MKNQFSSPAHIFKYPISYKSCEDGWCVGAGMKILYRKRFFTKNRVKTALRAGLAIYYKKTHASHRHNLCFFKLVDYRFRGIRVKITNTYEYHKLHEYTTTKAVNSAEKFGLYGMSKTYALVCGQHRFSVCR